MAQRQLDVGFKAPRAYECGICGKTFTLRTNRNRHLRNTHGQAVSDDALSVYSARAAKDEHVAPSGSELECLIIGTVKKMIARGFSGTSEALVADARALAPSLTHRDAQVMVTAAWAAINGTAALGKAVGLLEEAGDTSNARTQASKRIGYAIIGPAWTATRPEVDSDDGACLDALSAQPVDRSAITQQWVQASVAAPSTSEAGSDLSDVTLRHLLEVGASRSLYDEVDVADRDGSDPLPGPTADVPEKSAVSTDRSQPHHRDRNSRQSRSPPRRRSPSPRRGSPGHRERQYPPPRIIDHRRPRK